MKHTLLFMILLVMTLTTFAQQSEPLPQRKIGDATLYQIQDTAGGFAANTFAGMEKATFDKYATDGRIPSSQTAYLLKFSNTYVLFDATSGTPNGAFTANLAQAMGGKFEPEKISQVWITHLHGDHFGGLLNGDARRFPNAKVQCSSPEYDHWSKQNNVGVERVKKAYGDDFSGVKIDEWGFMQFRGPSGAGTRPGEESLPGKFTIHAINAVGHTPGQTVFLIESQGEKLLVIGDLLHAAALQFPLPEICASFDMDKAEAVKSRRRILDMAADENIPVAGMHFPSPGIGFVKKNADGYEFSPINK